jgi:DNA repair protein RecO (recombination protein O)
MKPSERLRTVEAVIISHKDYGEADRFVSFFSLEAGKIRGIAKGVRKMRSRKAAYLEPFMHSKLVLARGKTFWIITQADAIHQNLAIRESLSKTAGAAYVMELADRFFIEEEPSVPVFRLLVNTLKQINDREEEFNPLRFYELRLLEQAGFRPELTNCVGCGKEITAQDQYFSAVQGGVLCPDCGALHNNPRGVSVDTLRYLRHFQRSAFADIAAIKVPESLQNEMAALMQHYVSSIIERRLKSPEFMRQVKNTAADDPQVQ